VLGNSELDQHRYPATMELIQAILDLWPQHEKYLIKSFSGRPEKLLETTEFIAALLSEVAADRGMAFRDYAEEYKFFCEHIIFPEDVFFMREGRYRLSTFEDAAREVYDNAPLMTRYMNGLFVSDAIWLNHASAMNDFANTYLPGTLPGGAHLEIGPGHGMLLHLAIRFGSFSSLSAWDVSETSIGHTRHILNLRKCAGLVKLQSRNMCDPSVLEENRGRFNTIVLSEVLEHLEEPREALAIIRDLLAPGGTVWINVPANGPSPDHLFLLRSPEEAEKLVKSVDLEVQRTAAFPLAGYSLDRAVRDALAVSCVVVGRKKA
jgi:2-polyprenyl-3-methyl-5-hydroxy-6-metoxy-1,4-benzoquinol methylase